MQLYYIMFLYSVCSPKLSNNCVYYSFNSYMCTCMYFYFGEVVKIAQLDPDNVVKLSQIVSTI